MLDAKRAKWEFKPSQGQDKGEVREKGRVHSFRRRGPEASLTGHVSLALPYLFIYLSYE